MTAFRPRPTLTARDRFALDGYLVLPCVVPMGTVARLRVEADSIIEQLVAQMEKAQTADPRVTWWRLPSSKLYVLKVKPVVDMAPTAADVANSVLLRQWARLLLGARPRLMEDKLMYKQEIGPACSWAETAILGEEVCKHTDAAYFAARGFGRVLTVAVCLDDCTEASGALRVWPRTHLQTIEHVPTPSQGPVVPDHVAPDSAAVMLDAAAGSVLIWDSALVHASGPNRSCDPRRLLVLGYTTADGNDQ